MNRNFVTYTSHLLSSEMIWTVAAVSANKMQDGVNITGHCSDGAAFRQQTAMVVRVCEKPLRRYQLARAWTRVAKWKAIIMVRNGPRGFPWNEGVSSSVICCLWGYREHLGAALCPGPPKAGSVLRPPNVPQGHGNLYRLPCPHLRH